MNLISPPTDSLYKFMGIGGLVFLITSTVLIFQKIDYVYDSFDKIYGDERAFSQEVNLIMDELIYSGKYLKNSDQNLELPIRKYLFSEKSDKSDSIIKNTIYNLPEPLQNKLKKLSIKYQRLIAERNWIEDHESELDLLIYVFIFLIAGFSFIMVFGMVHWYYKIQKPIDEEKDKANRIDGYYTNCQSCLKTFILKDDFGLEKDGTQSKCFCSDCYSDGTFINPSLSIDEATNQLIGKLKESKYNKRKINRKIKELETTLRWKRQKIW